MDLKALLTNPKQAPLAAVLLLGAAAYFGAAELGLALASLNPHAAPVAPAAGLGVALLMLFGRRAWPAITLGALAAHGLAGGGIGIAGPIAVGETLAALAGQLVLSRNLTWHGEKLPLGTTLGYAAASLLASVISASVGLQTLHLSDSLGHASGVEVWLTWWTGHALALFLLVPALLSLTEADRRRLQWNRLWKFALLVAITLAVNLIALSDWRAGIAIFLSFPLVLIAFRWFSIPAGLWLAVLVAGTWILATALGFGPFTGTSQNAGLVNVQILAAALAFAAVALADFGTGGSRWIGIVFSTGAAIAALVFFASDLNRRSHDIRQFNELIQSATEELQKRIGTYTDILRGGASMFAASDGITRSEWEVYVNSIDLLGRYPGVYSMGLVVPVRHADLNAFRDYMRDDGLPLFTARPVPGGVLGVDEHFLIIREGPESLRRSPVGLDLGSEPKRRSAAIAARDFGVPTMSHSVMLATDGGQRQGFVLFVPSYWAHRPVGTVAERRAAFRGWINAPVAADLFFTAAFKRFGDAIQVEVFNGVGTNEPAVFSNFGLPDQVPAEPARRETLMMLSGHAFQIAWQPGPAFASASRSEPPLLSAAVILIATIFSALVANLQSTGARATAIAQRITADLAASNERFRLTEARLKAAIEGMDSGFALFDADDRLILHNRTFIDAQTQAAFGDPIGHSFEEFVRFNIVSHSALVETGPDTEAWVARRMEQHRNPSDVPFEMRLSTGQWLQVTERRTADGGYMGIWTDITGVKQAQERLTNAINAMTDGFVLFDRDLKIVLCNQPWADYVGQASPESIVGRPALELLREFAHGEVTDISAKADPEAFTARVFEQHVNPREEAQERVLTDGRRFSVVMRRTSDGGRVGIFSDVTALRAAETRLREAIESINEGFALFDADLRYVQFNRRLLELYPKSAPAIKVGAKLEDVLRYGAERGEVPELDGRKDIDTFVADWMRCFKRREPFVGEEMLADGRWTLVSHRPTADGGFVSIRSDITAQKNREIDLEAAKTQLEGLTESLIATTGDLRAARERAEEANRFKSNFLAQMTHELRTPLNAVIGFSDLIQQEIFGAIEPPRYREYVGLISDSGKHLLSLINDVLDLSKIEAGRMELTLDRLNASALAHGAAAMFGKMAADRGLKLECRAVAPCRELHGDERVTNQIIYNLLSNAVKFTPQGGRVDLEFVESDAGVDIVVRDTGIGMSEAEITKAMRPYGQIGSALVKNVEGTGLGLPLVKSLIELHRGTFQIASVKGKGTTMTVHFPWQPLLEEQPQRAAG
ncbi:PAS-domain containing protein [Dongia sp.]|uniref:PAS-domain containing protein n=1 Tax=Dongia sp. TaxID=1977262 RepID=UPI00375315A9